MNAIRTIENMPSVTNLRGKAKYQPIGFGLFVYSLTLTNWLKKSTRILELEKFGESATPYSTERGVPWYITNVP